MESYTNRLFTPFPFVSLLLGDAKGINQPTIHYTGKTAVHRYRPVLQETTYSAKRDQLWQGSWRVEHLICVPNPILRPPSLSCRYQSLPAIAKLGARQCHYCCCCRCWTRFHASCLWRGIGKTASIAVSSPRFNIRFVVQVCGCGFCSKHRRLTTDMPRYDTHCPASNRTSSRRKATKLCHMIIKTGLFSV